jgi:hypothetical protein
VRGDDAHRPLNTECSHLLKLQVLETHEHASRDQDAERSSSSPIDIGTPGMWRCAVLDVVQHVRTQCIAVGSGLALQSDAVPCSFCNRRRAQRLAARAPPAVQLPQLPQLLQRRRGRLWRPQRICGRRRGRCGRAAAPQGRGLCRRPSLLAAKPQRPGGCKGYVQFDVNRRNTAHILWQCSHLVEDGPLSISNCCMRCCGSTRGWNYGESDN